MLAKLLAVGIGLGSLTFYVSAFFFPEVHRRHDFFWSGVGMFYALVLWVCAGRFTGALLLGQVASATLVVWLGWQTLRLRRAKTPILLQTPATAAAWRGFRQEIADLLNSLLAATPLGRWLPSLQTSSADDTHNDETPLRAAPIKDVGYEFIDDIDAPDPDPRLVPANTSAKASPSPPKASPSQPATPSRPQPGLWQKGTIVANWAVDMVKSMTRPKPPRPVIDIPPRPASPSAPSAETAAPSPPVPEIDTNWPDADADGNSEVAGSLASPELPDTAERETAAEPSQAEALGDTAPENLPTTPTQALDSSQKTPPAVTPPAANPETANPIEHERD